MGAQPTEVDSVWLFYTKPRVKVTAGCPPFKTQKLLGGRAIVSDTFSQPAHMAANYAIADVEPGMALYAHREGYNVLYGDGSANWFGDPQQKILWWSSQWNASSTNWIRAGLDLNPGVEYTTRDAVFGGMYYNLKNMQGLAIWHQFDVAGGIDNGVDD